MKALIVLSAILIAGISEINAQTKTHANGGLYLTADDFKQQKLTYEVDCGNAGDKIKTNNFFASSTGYILSKGEKHSFNKNKVYGYRDCHNKNYRFYKVEAYLMIDTAGFYIYYKYMPEENAKGKEPIKNDEYFFSKNADGNLQLLTVDNLKNAFPDNHRFHYAIDTNFKSDKDLIAYDSYQKTYKIKYLYNQSVK